MVNYLEEDIPKYHKKRNSTKSKSYEKSKHKHEYVDCVLIEGNKLYESSYCRECGKIKNIILINKYVIENGEYKVLTNDELLERYKDLEKIKVDNIWVKYIPIVKS